MFRKTIGFYKTSSFWLRGRISATWLMCTKPLISVGLKRTCILLSAAMPSTMLSSFLSTSTSLSPLSLNLPNSLSSSSLFYFWFEMVIVECGALRYFIFGFGLSSPWNRRNCFIDRLSEYMGPNNSDMVTIVGTLICILFSIFAITTDGVGNVMDGFRWPLRRIPLQQRRTKRLKMKMEEVGVQTPSLPKVQTDGLTGKQK